MSKDANVKKRREWIPPAVTSYGAVEDLTNFFKDFGASDGMTFEGDPIMDVPGPGS